MTDPGSGDDRDHPRANPNHHSHTHDGHGHSHDGHSHDGHSHSHEAHSHDGHSHEAHSHEAHSHEAHSHDGHSHDGHSHDGHSHSHEAHSHDGHSHDGHEHPARPQLEGAEAEGLRPELPRGAGTGKWLFLDPASGIAGDMTIAALLHLGVPFRVVNDAVQSLGLPGIALKVCTRDKGAVSAFGFDVTWESGQPQRNHAEIQALLNASQLSPPVRVLASDIFQRLAQAEADVHRVPVEDVHFHEVGAVDAIADIVGAAAAFDYIGATVICAPLPMGRGFVDCQHGRIPLPAPATVGCLKGVPCYDAGIDGELVTPTGAAIVGTVAAEFSRWPSMSVLAIGWGGGNKTWPDRPNALRVLLGEKTTENTHATSRHMVFEANIDDMTGELAGHALEQLLSAGALDAWICPILMKKSRPALMLCAIAEASRASDIVDVYLGETTTLGVRKRFTDRDERPRTIITVTTMFGEIPVKIARGDGRTPNAKPEFAICVEVARRHDVPVSDVLAAASNAAQKLISTGD